MDWRMSTKWREVEISWRMSTTATRWSRSRWSSAIRARSEAISASCSCAIAWRVRGVPIAVVGAPVAGAPVAGAVAFGAEYAVGDVDVLLLLAIGLDMGVELGTVEADHLVAPRLLRDVEGVVGRLHERVAPADARMRPRRHPEAARPVDGAAVEG